MKPILTKSDIHMPVYSKKFRQGDVFYNKSGTKYLITMINYSTQQACWKYKRTYETRFSHDTRGNYFSSFWNLPIDWTETFTQNYL